MKKVFDKIRRKKAPEPQGRITTETIAEHRERILAGGRRFKYPVQYARHKLVINAVLIAVGTLILLTIVGWWQLYIVQNTSDFMYRVTRVLPVAVAEVEGQPVRYSDYLMKYRSSIHYLEEKERVNLSTEDGQRQSDFVKSRAMEDAIADAYAVKLAKEQNISVSDVELEEFLKQQRTSPDGEVSEATYDAVILDYYGWSPDEYREAMKSKLLRQKVGFAIDEGAKDRADRVTAAITGGNTNLREIAETVTAESGQTVTFSSLGFLPKSNQDGGVTATAARLDVGEVSDVILSTIGDGYYFVKVLETNSTQVNYESLQIPLTAFSQRLGEALASDERVKEYIEIPDVSAPENQ